MIKISQRTIETGLPVVSLEMPGTRAVTVLVAFDAGARTERPEENGMAHFLEHLVFKGGEKYATYRDVNKTAERLGAQLNAYTSHDLVAFHITCRAEAIHEAVDLLTDFVGRARIDAEELDRERGVVIQEINRSERRAVERRRQAARPRGLRRASARARGARPGRAPARPFSRDAIVAFRERRWAAERGGAFLVGDVEPPAGRGEARRAVRSLPRAAGPAPPRPRRRSSAALLVERADTNQSHLRLA